MFGEYRIEVVRPGDAGRVREIEAFLARFALTFDRDVEHTIAAREADRLVGTGSFAGEVLRNIAVDENIRGTGLAALILSELMQEQARRGRLHYFIFTKPANARLFSGLGFREIVRAEPYVALLETGLGSIDTYCDTVANEAARLAGQRAAVVVNCNPFTKGHQALIGKAAAENGGVIVFVVSEDKSLFPFEHRIRLVKAGVAAFPNVAVVSAGKYIVSAATFPTYFTREEDKVAAQTRLDATLFAAVIAPRLGITARYIGEEPYCPVTNAYNEAMLAIMPHYGVDIVVMKRVQADGEIISASKVRDMIRRGDWAGVQKAVPATTYEYLLSAEAQAIVDKIRTSDSRH